MEYVMSRKPLFRTSTAGLLLAATVSVTVMASSASAQSGANQPRMQAALDALQKARTELQAAVANKGGHRVKAISLVNDAIAEVKAGIAAAD